MTERHGGEYPRLVTAPVSASWRRSESGETHKGEEWRESRNGHAEPAEYPLGAAQAADAAREQEVAGLVAAAQAEALRRARERLGPGPLQRIGAGGWVLVGEDEGAAS